MPVFLGGVAVSLDISDKLAVCLCCCIKTKGSFNIFILQIAVDRLRASDDLYACLMRCHVLGKNSCICVGIVTADDNDCCDTVLFADLCGNSELFLCLKFGPSGTDDIKTACISVLINIGIVKNDVIIIQKSARTALEAIKDVLLIRCFQSVIQTAYDVMSAGSLSAGKNNTNDLFLRCGCILSLLKRDLLFSVCVREKGFDLFLISNALCRLAFLYADISDSMSEHARKLRGILVSCFLKR